MAATSVQSLSTLLQRSTVVDHEEVVRACNAVLKNSKHDIGTQHIKVVALLKLERFEDVIRVIEEGGEPLKMRAPLEWSYALYKTGKLNEAVEVAASSGMGRGAKHVEAQAVCVRFKTVRSRQGLITLAYTCRPTGRKTLLV
jgi:signal recognition particle subunit SRP72